MGKIHARTASRVLFFLQSWNMPGMVIAYLAEDVYSATLNCQVLGGKKSVTTVNVVFLWKFIEPALAISERETLRKDAFD